MMIQRILRRPEVEKMVGLSRSTIYSMISDGDFPKPVKLGKRAVGWTDEAISQWMSGRNQTHCSNELASSKQ